MTTLPWPILTTTTLGMASITITTFDYPQYTVTLIKHLSTNIRRIYKCNAKI